MSLIKKLLWICLFAVSIYGAGRLYYQATGGFTLGNMQSDFAYDPRWEMTPLSAKDSDDVNAALDQPFSYLGKGCQSYVFLSQDGQYVIKFLKYQRFRIQPWLNYFSFITAVDHYRLEKMEKKQKKLDALFNGWKVAFENLQPETQVLFVHLNKTDHLNRNLTIYDKMGFEHMLALDQTEFLLQRKADMLCDTIKAKMKKGEVAQTEQLLDRVVQLIVSEYQRGFADHDHALMQNTGIFEGYPIHIDVGQFVIEPQAKNPEVYKQELFNKMYKFRKWLNKRYPDLALYLDAQLRLIIGKEFDAMRPHFIPHDEK